jgi:hypothetical protein
MKENTTKPLSLRFSPKVRKTIKKLSDDSGITQSQLFEMVLMTPHVWQSRSVITASASLRLKFEIAD